MLRIDLADALEEAGITVAEAGSAEDALSLLETDSNIDVLLTDIRLEGKLDGWDLAEVFREMHPDRGVIYASANAPVENRLVSNSKFFTKPVSLHAVVRSCLSLCAARHRPGA